MPRRAYRGETNSKAIARWLVWAQHKRLLKSAFGTSTHAFLASKTGKDAEFLLDIGVLPQRVWAVECDRAQYVPLIALKQKLGFVLHTSLIESVVEKHAESWNRGSVYLDYCGTLEGTRKTTRRVTSCLPLNSVETITVLRGRELSGSPESREIRLLKQLRAASPHRVELVQSILYTSEDADTLGSPMETLTFFIGDVPSKSKFRFNLTHDVVKGVTAEEGIKALWENAETKARRLSLSAKKANRNR